MLTGFDMIKPFVILDTRPEEGGTGVMYEVSSRDYADNKEITKTLRGYLLVLDGEDIDATVYEYLKACGWIE